MPKKSYFTLEARKETYLNLGSVASEYMAVAPPNEWPIIMGFDRSSLPWNVIEKLFIVREYLSDFTKANDSK